MAHHVAFHCRAQVGIGQERLTITIRTERLGISEKRSTVYAVKVSKCLSINTRQLYIDV